MSSQPAPTSSPHEKVKTPQPSPSKVGHSLPQMPSMTPTRVAVSKNSRKSDPPAADNPFANVVTMEDIEGKPANNNKQLPNSLPTPPSEKSTDNSPPKSQPQDTAPPSVPSPIKLRIHRSPELGKLTSTVEDIPDSTPTAPDKSSGRARTKEDIKKQLLMKKGKHRQESQSPAHAGVDKETIPAALTASPAASPHPATPSAPAPPASDPPAPIPTAARRISVVEDDEGVPVHYLVGDMVWSKVTGHPYWPSMISFDPFTGVFTSLKKGRNRQYHVQFFGDEGERGWIAESQMIKYEGRGTFETWLAEKVRKAKGKDKKNYQVAAARRKAWEVGVCQAEHAFSLSTEQRRHQYTFEYSLPAAPTNAAEAAAAAEGGGTGKKRKLSLTPSQQQPRKKQRRRSSRAKPNHASLAQYRVFCQEKRDQVRRDHPAYTEKQMEQSLQQMWEELTEEEQAKYSADAAPGAGNTGEGEGSSSSNAKRTPKPTKKRQESDDVGGRRRSRKKTPAPGLPKPTAVAAEADSTADSTVAAPAVAADSTEQQQAAQPPPTDSASDAVGGGGDASAAPAAPAAASETQPKTKKSRCQKSPEDDCSSSHTSSGKEDSASTTSNSTTPAPQQKRKRQSHVTKELAAAAVAGVGEQKDNFEIELMKLSASGPSKKENVCAICEQAGELIVCDGPCCGAYHLSCLGLTVQPTGAFKCDECATGRHTCFVCKKAGNSSSSGSEAAVERCSVAHCGRFYHTACAAKYRLTERDARSNMHCPLHTCATCAAITPTNTAKNSKGRMYKCVRCPTAYHVGDLCIAAGSIHLAGLHIVCSKHFAPLKQMSHHSRINVSWCFNCSKGGTLLCCDMCPAAYHVSCLGKEQQPPPEEEEGEWHCADCKLGRKPLYGDIIWVKLGSYRWWPGEICHPKNVPHNIQEKAHQVGEFPIHFFGTHDYFWTHMGRVFLFQEGDKGSKELANAKGLVKVFQKAVQEATRGFQLYKKMKEAREKLELDKVDRKPLPYKHIKCNVPIGNVATYRRTGEESEVPRCECRMDAEQPCGRDSECINRMMMYECSPAVCVHGEKCLNQRFCKRKYPHTQVDRAEGCGWGLRTQEDLKKGEFVNEYVGDLIDEAECRQRIQQAHSDNITNFYMLTMDANRVIDAGPKGNYSRFMNHSCDPNCETQKWMVNGDLRIGLFARRDVSSGEYLTFNYNLECRGDEKTVCKCGADICSGFLGVRPKTQAAAENEKKAKKKKKKRAVVKRTEDECYRCGDGGELVMCDKKDCPKAYHLECLNMAKPPHGQWTCPWHFCDLCEKRAKKLCIECPNSFCPEHIAGNIFLCPDSRLVCSDHDDLLATLEPEQKVSLPNEPLRGPGGSSSSSSSCDSQAASDEEGVIAAAVAVVEEADTTTPQLLVTAAQTVIKEEQKKSDEAAESESNKTLPQLNGVATKPEAVVKAQAKTEKGAKSEAKTEKAAKSEAKTETKTEKVAKSEVKSDTKTEKSAAKSEKKAEPKAKAAKKPRARKSDAAKPDAKEPSADTADAKTNGEKTPLNNKSSSSSSSSKSSSSNSSATKKQPRKSGEKRKSTSKKEPGEGKRNRKSAAALEISVPPPVSSDLPPVIFNDDSDNDNLVIDM